MQSRRDQLQAYKFLTRRALAALVAGEPDVPEAPMRRLTLTTITGIMVAVLVIAGFAVVGFLRPGSNTKVSGGTIYIERDTGAQFVLLGDDKLHPTLNYTSAVLALSGDSSGKVGVKTVPPSVLTKKPHGATVGIDGVPQSLPRGTGDLIRSPWTICSHIAPHGASNNVAAVKVTVGGTAGATTLGPEDAAVVATPGERQPYLLWHGKRLKIASADVATALELQTSQPVIVGSSLLNALPQGPSLATPSVPGAGKPGPKVGGKSTLVGQLVEITDNHSYELVLADGITSVKPVAAALLQTLRLDGQLRSPVPVSRAAVLDAPQSAAGASVLQQFRGLPSVVPSVPDAPAQAGGVCVEYREGGASSLAVPRGSASTTGGAVSESSASRRGVADEVDVPAGKAALVVADNGAASRFIVAAGKKFSVGAEGLAGFGYGDVSPVKLPAQLLLLLPSGPALDPHAATRVARGS